MSHINECPSIGPEDRELSGAVTWVSKCLREHLSRFAEALDTEKLHDVRTVLDWQQNTPILGLAIPPLENLLGVRPTSRLGGPGAAFHNYSRHVIGALRRELEAIQEQTLSAGIPRFTQAARQLNVHVVNVLSKFETAILGVADQASGQRHLTGQDDAYSLNDSLRYPTSDVIRSMFDYGSSETKSRCMELRQALTAKSDNVQSLAALLCMADRFHFLSFSNLDYYQKTVYRDLDTAAAMTSTRLSNGEIVGLLADAQSEFVESANQRKEQLAAYW